VSGTVPDDEPPAAAVPDPDGAGDPDPLDGLDEPEAVGDPAADVPAPPSGPEGDPAPGVPDVPDAAVPAGPVGDGLVVPPVLVMTRGLEQVDSRASTPTVTSRTTATTTSRSGAPDLTCADRRRRESARATWRPPWDCRRTCWIEA
jgi:hypothetical protein